MRLLFLSFYFEPDLCAGSFRAAAVARALLEADPALEIELITTRPNRYDSFKVSAEAIEQRDRLTIIRCELPPHKSGMADQALAFVSYGRQTLERVRGRQYDAVLATSSRLMTAALASLIAQQRGLPLYLDVRDIFVDTMGDLLNPLVARPASLVLGLLERWTMRRARRINLVSRGFSDYFRTRYPEIPLSFSPNGIDDEFIGVDAAGLQGTRANDATVVLYAGNIGQGQGLELIVPKLAQALPNFRFRIIGDGGRAEALASEVRRLELSNVALEKPMKRSELVAASLSADILFLHLNDHAAFRKVLPSKLFEYGALGKPVWAGVAGYPAEFIDAELENAAVFQPCDVEDALRSLATLRLESTPRREFVGRYARRSVSRELAADILATLFPSRLAENR